MSAAADAKAAKAAKTNDDGEKAFVDFSALSSQALHSYISYYDLANSYPPPDTTVEDSRNNASSSSSSRNKSRRGSTRNVSPAPSSGSRKRTADVAGLDSSNGPNGNGVSSTSKSGSAVGNGNGASTTSAAAAGTATTTTTVEDDPPCPPHFFDADAASLYLSQVAAKHFAAQPTPKEGEVVVGFLYKCKAKGELNRPVAHHRIKGQQAAGVGIGAATTAAAAGAAAGGKSTK